MAARLASTVLVLLVAVAAATTNEAAACSCAPGDPRRMLAQSDAAFVGRLVERSSGPVSSSADPAIYRFKVEQTVKGQLGEHVDVVAAASGASCGIEARLGERIGLFLGRSGGGWRSSLCQQVDPQQLLAAARPLPAPNGEGPVALLAGGSFGTARTIALDRNGRTLAYGYGKGETLLLTACPGGTRAIEIARNQSSLLLAVRDLRTMRLIREQPLRLPEQLRPSTADCRTPSGDDLLLFATREAGPLGVIRRLREGRWQELYRGGGVSAVFGARHAYLTAGRLANRLVAVDLRTRGTRQLRRVPTGTGALALSPDERRLAAVAYSAPFLNAPPSRVLTIDLGRRTHTLRSAPLGAPNVSGRISWLGQNQLAFLPGGGDRDALRVYDANLRLERRIDWPARLGVVRGTTAYGISWDRQARILRAELRAGRPRVAGTLPTQTVFSFEAVGPIR